MKELEACTARVEAKYANAKPGDEISAHCTGQYFDFWHCIDHCVSTPPRAHTRTRPPPHKHPHPANQELDHFESPVVLFCHSSEMARVCPVSPD